MGALTDCIVHGRVVAAGQELRVEVDHDQAAVLGQRLQDVILDVSARIAQLVGGGMREYHRCLAHLQGVPHRALGDVGQIDHHSQSIHFADDCLKGAGIRMSGLVRGAYSWLVSDQC